MEFEFFRTEIERVFTIYRIDIILLQKDGILTDFLLCKKTKMILQNQEDTGNRKDL